jgi:hypothetical protein
MGENKSAYRVFVGNPERKIPLGRDRRGWQGIVELWMKV